VSVYFLYSLQDLVTVKTKELGYVTAFDDQREIPLPPESLTLARDPQTGDVTVSPTESFLKRYCSAGCVLVFCRRG
jgi:hypothetical protein